MICDNCHCAYMQRYKDAEPTIYTPPQPPPITPEIESKMREMEKKQHYARRLGELIGYQVTNTNIFFKLACRGTTKRSRGEENRREISKGVNTHFKSE